MFIQDSTTDINQAVLEAYKTSDVDFDWTNTDPNRTEVKITLENGRIIIVGFESEDENEDQVEGIGFAVYFDQEAFDLREAEGEYEATETFEDAVNTLVEIIERQI